MVEIILFTVSVVPVIILARYVYNRDQNKETPKMLTKLFLGGILSVILVTFISLILHMIIPIFLIDIENQNLIELIFHAFIAVALIEEWSKWIVLYKMSFNNYEYDETYDMIVYAVFVSLGFAFLENLLYVYSYGVVTGFTRGLLSIPGHAFFGVFMGYYLNLAKISSIKKDENKKNKYLLSSIVVPVLLHGFYDYCLLTQKPLFLFIFLIFVLIFFYSAFKKIKQESIRNIKFKFKNNFCTNCGCKIQSNFCTNCGKKNE